MKRTSTRSGPACGLARENARSVREIISSEMWEHLNEFYLRVNSAAGRKPDRPAGPVAFDQEVRPSVHRRDRRHDDPQRELALLPARMHAGARRQDVAHPRREVLSPAAYRSRRRHDVGRHPVGRRAALGQRIRDVPEVSRAHRARTRRGVSAVRDRVPARHPVPASSGRATSVHAISGTPAGMFRHPVERLFGELCSELAYARVETIIAAGLHEYLDRLQTRINQIGTEISETFFAARGTPVRKKARGRRAAAPFV